MPVSHILSPRQVRELINSHAFAEYTGLPLTAVVTIRWQDTVGWRDSLFQPRMTHLTHSMGRWLSYEAGVPPVYQWIAENTPFNPSSQNHGLHAHMRVHVPFPAIWDFIRAFPQWVAGAKDRPNIIFFSGGEHPFRASRRARIGTLKYYLKGAGAMVRNQLGIDDRGPQGIIYGQRCRVSHSIGREARGKAGFQNLHAWPDLRNVLWPEEAVAQAA